MGLLALGLGLLTIFGPVQLWQVYGFALLLGCVTAFDAPARQTFVSDLVGEADLANAVALNSTSFNAARMIGPAVAGVLIAVGRDRLGVPDQRGLLRRRARVAALLRVDELQPSQRAAADARQPRRGLPLCLAAARSDRRDGHAVPDRHLRA